MQMLKKESSTLNKGMVKQPNPLFTPEGTYYYALNAMLGSREGDAGSLTNEEGNEICFQLPPDSSIIGHVMLDNNISVIFVTDNTYSYIIKFDPDNCESTILIKSACLNFKTYKQIGALYRMVRGCERTIYFTDGFNPYRSINLDKLEDYLNPGFATPEDANLSPINGWNCDLFKHFREHNVPCIEFSSMVDSNSTLKPGVVQFSIRYLDDSNNPTNWIYITNPLPLFSEPISSIPSKADGDKPFSDVDLNYVNKVVILLISNLDTRFKYYQLAAIETHQGLGTVTDVYVLEKKQITLTSTSDTYIYSGFNSSIHTVTTIEELTNDTIYLDTVETHTQIDNRLILGNVTAFTTDWGALQRSVLLTDVKWETAEHLINTLQSPIDSDNVAEPNASGNTRDPRYHYETMTYMRDEVYAFGIVFVFKNGTKSPVFHIPGRAADTYYNRDFDNGDFIIQYGDDITDDIVIPLDNIAIPYRVNNHYRDGGITAIGGSGVSGAWDTQDLTVVPDGFMQGIDGYNKVEYSNVAHIPSFEFEPSGCTGGCSLPAGTWMDIVIDNIVGANTFDLVVSTSLPGNWKSNIRIACYRYDLSVTLIPQVYLFDIISEVTNLSNTITINYPNINTFSLTFTIAASLSDGTCGSPMISYDGGIYGANMITITTPYDLEPFPAVGISRTIQFPENEPQSYIGCTIPRWKVYNTAINIKNFSLPPEFATGAANSNIGLMGYHQLSTKYPESTDCNGVSIWDASSIGGQDLSDAYIRHHRFPDLNLLGQNLVHANLSLAPDHRVSLISVRFDLTDVYNSIPVDIQSEIIGHYIVRSERAENNKTVLDKGFTFNNQGIEEDSPYNHIFKGVAEKTFFSSGQCYSKSIEYISNKMLYQNNVTNGSYMKYEACTEMKGTDNRDIKKEYYTELVGFASYNSYFLFKALDYNNYPDITKIWDCRAGVHRPINNSILVPWNAEVTSTVTSGTYDTNLYTGTTGFYEMNIPFLFAFKPIPTNYNYYNNLSFILMSEYNASASRYNNFFGNNVGTRINYVAIKVYKDVYQSLEALFYMKTHNCLINKNDYIFNIYGGDIFVTESQVVKGFAKRAGIPIEDYIDQNNSTVRLYIESEINSGLRYSDDFRSQYYPRYFFNSDPSPDSTRYYLDVRGFTRDNNAIDDNVGENNNINTWLKPYIYKYNPDYSKLNDDKNYFPLSNNFNYCDNCQGKEQYTIYYSNKVNVTDVQDSYKIILPGSFKIMPSEAGIITNLFVEQDQLHCHTEKALWLLQAKPQQLDTNESTLYIGTGAFLSIPPRRIISTRYGYAGSNDKFATINTQFGTFFIDSMAGQVFQYGSGLKEISQTGMEQWFRKYLPLKFPIQYKQLTGLQYDIRHTVDKNSVGYQSVFDPRFKRFILHKKDYEILDPAKFTVISYGDEVPSSDTYNLYAQVGTETDTEYVVWYYYSGEEEGWLETDLNNTNYFSNESFTISFSTEINSWISFHSYQPNFMFNDRNKYYTYINNKDREIWVHNERRYQNYYNKKYDHIIEVTFNPQPAQEKIFESVQYVSNTYNYVLKDSRFVNLENVTFDRFELSNNNQSSDTRDLIVKVGAYDKLNLTPTETMVDRTDNYWRFNRFRDMAIDRGIKTLFSTDWAYTNTYYDSYGQGYVDAVVNPTSIDLNKPYYQQARFRDKVAFLRLFFNPGNNDDYKIATEVISILIKPSLR